MIGQVNFESSNGSVGYTNFSPFLLFLLAAIPDFAFAFIFECKQICTKSVFLGQVLVVFSSLHVIFHRPSISNRCIGLIVDCNLYKISLVGIPKMFSVIRKLQIKNTGIFDIYLLLFAFHHTEKLHLLYRPSSWRLLC